MARPAYDTWKGSLGALGGVLAVVGLIGWQPSSSRAVVPDVERSASLPGVGRRTPSSPPTQAAPVVVDAFARCADACPAGSPASCHVDCGVALAEADPADGRAWFVARMGAMEAGDQATYRQLLASGPRGDTPGVRWGRWVAATLPQTQELLLRQVADAGWQGTVVARALGADACGMAGPSFVVCVP